MCNCTREARKFTRKTIVMKNLTLNTALFICTVFVFRIVFFNILAFSSANLQQTSGAVKVHFSMGLKGWIRSEMTEIPESAEYSFDEICEEKDVREETRSESNPFFLIQVLYSLVTTKVPDKLKEIAAFYNYLSHTSSQRYLSFQVLRT